MRINNIQRSEIITTNRRGVNFGTGINNKISFRANAKNTEKIAKAAAPAVKPLLPQHVINHFGLDMTTAVKYKGAPNYTPAPDTLAPDVKRYLNMLEVDWGSHIDPAKPKKSFL